MIELANGTRVEQGSKYIYPDTLAPATEVWLIYGLRRAVPAIPVPQSNQNESPETEVPSSPVSLSKLAMVLRGRK